MKKPAPLHKRLLLFVFSLCVPLLLLDISALLWSISPLLLLEADALLVLIAIAVLLFSPLVRRPPVQQHAPVAQESLLEAVLDHMEEGVTVYAPDGQLLFVNRAARKYGLCDMLASSTAADAEVNGLYHADGKTPLYGADTPFAKLLRDERVHQQEVWVKPAGKPVSILLANGKKVDSLDSSAHLLVTHDITQRKWAEQRLEISEQRYKSLFEHNLDIICWLGLDGKLVNANKATLAITGFAQHELSQLAYESLLAPAAYAMIRGCFHEAIKGHSQHFEISVRHKLGHAIHLSASLVPIVVSGVVIGVYLIAKDITQRKQAEDMARYLAYHDTLTGLPNRAMFLERLQVALETAKRQSVKVAVLFLDLDRFKLINDTLGHSIGDRLLQTIGRRLTSCVRQQDIVARLGGDEFTLILPAESRQAVIAVAERILQVISEPQLIDDHECFVTPSMGISTFPFDGEDAETLIKHADTAMYRAKEKGKNNYQFYAAEMNESLSRKVELEKELRKALDNGEFTLHYQPQVAIDSGKMIGLEALIRWQHPVLGLVSPAEFIPLAEETGLIVPIGEWVLRTACQQNMQWQANGFPPLRIAVNLSVRQLQERQLVATVERILRETGLNPHFLDLEITESIAMNNLDDTIPLLTALKRLGIRISIDDFGTGYSSLGSLHRLPIDTIKIDRSFLCKGPTSDENKHIVAAIIAMAHSLNLHVIAEGIEEEAQLQFLHSLACEEGQGYLFSRPLPAELLEQSLGLGETDFHYQERAL